jgi:hypothetical protein
MPGYFLSAKKSKMMDTSKRYIEMCEKAEEIQKIEPSNSYSKFQQGNVYHFDDRVYYQHVPPNVPGIKTTWLPRQDQLQDMIKAYDDKEYTADEKRAVWFMVYEFSVSTEFDSFESLWLQFVMCHKYFKIWKDQEWIKIN